MDYIKVPWIANMYYFKCKINFYIIQIAYDRRKIRIRFSKFDNLEEFCTIVRWITYTKIIYMKQD